MKSGLLLTLGMLIILFPLPAFAGEAVWNPSGTVAAYIDFIDSQYNESFYEKLGVQNYKRNSPIYIGYGNQIMFKTIFFYNKQDNNRYRGSFYCFGDSLTTEFNDGFPTTAPYLKIVKWYNDSSVLLQASFDYNCEKSTFYRVSTSGDTAFLYAEGVSDYEKSWINDREGEECGVDFRFGSALEKYFQSICSGEMRDSKEPVEVIIRYPDKVETVDIDDIKCGWLYPIVEISRDGPDPMVILVNSESIVYTVTMSDKDGVITPVKFDLQFMDGEGNLIIPD
jgi:hypothetical protein